MIFPPVLLQEIVCCQSNARDKGIERLDMWMELPIENEGGIKTTQGGMASPLLFVVDCLGVAVGNHVL